MRFLISENKDDLRWWSDGYKPQTDAVHNLSVCSKGNALVEFAYIIFTFLSIDIFKFQGPSEKYLDDNFTDI